MIINSLGSPPDKPDPDNPSTDPFLTSLGVIRVIHPSSHLTALRPPPFSRSLQGSNGWWTWDYLAEPLLPYSDPPTRVINTNTSSSSAAPPTSAGFEAAANVFDCVDVEAMKARLHADPKILNQHDHRLLRQVAWFSARLTEEGHLIRVIY